MQYLLDTCILSEFVKPKPEQRVIDWLNEQDARDVFVSAVTVGEIQRGISALPQSNRRTRLEEWLDHQLPHQFANHILSIDAATFQTWGKLVARLQHEGRPMSVFDSLIAATALQQRLTIVTRNVTDFQYTSINILDPWAL